MANLIALSLVYDRVFMSADRKDDPVKIPQGKDPYISARTLSQYYYDTPAENAVLIIPASEPWLSRYARAQLAAKQNIKVLRVINPGCAAVLTDLYRHRQEGLALAVVQWDRTIEAVLLDTTGGMATVLSVVCDIQADNASIPQTLKKLLEEANKKPEEITRVILVEDARREDGAALGSLREWTGSKPVFAQYALQDTLQGACHYGAALMNKEKFVLMLDALPGTCGIKTVEGFCPIIERNTSFPCTADIWVYPRNAEQTGMEITLQEQSCTGNLSRIGVYRVDLPASAAQADRKIRIQIDVDTNGNYFLRVRDSRDQAMAVHQGQEGACPLPSVNPPVKEPVSEASRNAALEFLNVYDTLLLAMDYPSADPAYLRGISQTLKKMEEVFAGFGVEFYCVPGDSFDPRIHEAVMHTVSGRYGRNQVIRVLKKGVKADGKIVRFAVVQVAN